MNRNAGMEEYEPVRTIKELAIRALRCDLRAVFRRPPFFPEVGNCVLTFAERSDINTVEF